MNISYLRKNLFTLLLFLSFDCIAVPLSVSFEAPLQYEGGGIYPNNIVIDDINNDGHLDAIIAAESRLHFLIGDGLGALNKDNSLRPSFSSSGYFVTGDFNKDGILDLAVSQYTNPGGVDSFCGTTAGVVIYLGVGGEAPGFYFKHCVKRIYDAVVKSVGTGDFNEDGNLDIVINGVADSLRGGVGVFFGNGDGTFAATSAVIGANSTAIEVADVNADGHLDIISGGPVRSLLGNGDGSFTEVSFGGDAGVSIGDVTGDGVTDVIALYDDKVSFTSPPSFTTIRISFYDINGNIIRKSTSLPYFVKGITVTDLNNDNLDDLVVRFSGGSVQAYFSSGDGGLIEGPVINLITDPVQDGTSLLASGDWNEDGYTDLAMASRFTLKEKDSMLWITKQVPVNLVDTELPIVSLNTPASGNSVANFVTIEATASDNVAVIKVEFYVDDILISSSAGPTYSASWNTRTVTDGVHNITAKAIDATGNFASSKVSVTVANALPEITSVPPFNDNDAGVLYTYQVIATGDAPLTYVLINSPTGMVIDSVTGNVSWVPDRTQLGSNAVTVHVSNSLGSVEQSFNVVVVDTIAPSTPLNARVDSTVPDVSITLVWDASNDVVGVVGYRVYKYYHYSQFNKGWKLIADKITGLTKTVAWLQPFEKTNSKRFRIKSYDAAGNESDPSVTIFTPTGVNTAPVVSVSTSSALITLPINSVTLTGSATDDGLPNGTLSYIWKLRAGSVGVTFLNPYSAVTTAKFANSGHFELELMVNDGNVSSSAFVIVDVLPALILNRAPTITPMIDLSITLPLDTINITTEILDRDRLPEGRTLAYSWSVLSGPAVVNFTPVSGSVGATNLVTTQTQFTVAGTYDLQITASDGELSTTAIQRVIVKPKLDIPPTDANAETMDIVGVITAVATNSIIVNGITIWITDATIVKYDEFTSLAVGFSVDCKAQPNIDSSVTAIKMQVQQ